MADEVWNGVRPGDPIDDDRLLAFALGLDDDAELVEAAAADAELGRRLETVRAEVDQVAAGVRAAVPAPEDDYTDLADARWAGLQEFLTPAEERRSGSAGSRRWLRVLAPVAAVALAVAVGVSIIERQSGQNSMSVAERSGKVADSSGTSGGSAASAASSESGQGGSSGDALAGGTPAVATSPLQGGSAPAASPLAPVTPALTSSMNRLAALQEQMNDFAVIVLATAQQATDGFQDFVVLRVLRGDSPAMLHLKLAGRLADVGRLHLLMLEPFPETGAEPMPIVSAAPGEGWGVETTPSALVAAAEAQMFTSTVPVVYMYEGDMAVARALPADTDPATVTLP